MNSSFTFKDGKVYYEGALLKGISSEHFDYVYNTNQNGEPYIQGLKDKKGIWWFRVFSDKPKVKFLTTDVDNFEFINQDFAKDRQFVYLVDKAAYPIPNSDAKTFTVLKDSPYFSKDKNQLYAFSGYSGLSIYSGADYDSLVSTGWNDYVTDKDNIYSCNGNAIQLDNAAKHREIFDGGATYQDYDDNDKISYNKQYLLKKFPDIKGWWHPDYEYQHDFPKSANNSYFTTDGTVFYLHKQCPTPMHGVDVETFKKLSRQYAKDRYNVYREHRVVEQADIESFEVIKGRLARDKDHYFFNGYLVDCDTDSFEIIQDNSKGQALVAKDKNSLFKEDKIKFGKVGMRTGEDYVLVPVKNSNSATFIIYNEAWAKDANQVYFYLSPFKKADAKSFRYLFSQGHEQWAQDDQYLFNYGRIVKGVDGASFEMLNQFWGKDKEHVFSFSDGKIVADLDVASFKVLDDDGGAEDKNYRLTSSIFGLEKTKK